MSVNYSQLVCIVACYGDALSSPRLNSSDRVCLGAERIRQNKQKNQTNKTRAKVKSLCFLILLALH